MPYTAVTKPSVGDPIKLSTIEGLIDNQTFFNTSLDTSSTFNADGNFEATPSGGDPAQGWKKTGAATVERTDTGGTNGRGKWALKFSGTDTDVGTIITDKFSIEEQSAYIISLGCITDDVADRFKCEFISWQRDGATGPVQTVENPRWYDGNNDGLNNTSYRRWEWVVDGGTDGKWAQIQITWTCKAGASSAGYLDEVTIHKAHREARFAVSGIDAAGAGTIEFYCPKYYRTELKQIIQEAASGPDYVTSTLQSGSWTNGGTPVGPSPGATYSANYATTASEPKYSYANSTTDGAIIYTPSWIPN